MAYQLYYPPGISRGKLSPEIYSTLDDAKNARECSGELVVHAGTYNVVLDPSWLWDWEKNNHDSYAFNHLGISL